MDPLDLRIDFEREPPVFRPGDPITGTVHLSANTDVECREVWARRAYRTPGKGNLDMGAFERVELDTQPQTLRSGEERAYPFRLTAPDGPPSQQGELFALEWVVQAGADLRGREDPLERKVFRLEDTVVSAGEKEAETEPPGTLRFVRLNELSPEEAERLRAMPEVEWSAPHASTGRFVSALRSLGSRSRKLVIGCLGCLYLPMLLALIVPLVSGTLLLREGRIGMGLAVIAFVLGILAFMLYMTDRSMGGAIRRRISELRFGSFGLKAPLDGLRRGKPLVWFVQLKPRRGLRIRRARARLQLVERMRIHARSQKSRPISSIYGTRTYTLDEPREVARGEELLLAGNVTLPPSWPASLYGNAEFRWTLQVTLELEAGMDWSREIRLDVG